MCYIEIAWLILLKNRLRTGPQYRLMQELQNRSGSAKRGVLQQQEIVFSWCQIVLQESWFSIGFILCRFLLICLLRKLQFNMHLGTVFFLKNPWEHYLRIGWEQYLRCSEYKNAKSVFTKYFLEFLHYRVWDFYEIFYAKFLSLKIIWIGKSIVDNF